IGNRAAHGREAIGGERFYESSRANRSMWRVCGPIHRKSAQLSALSLDRERARLRRSKAPSGLAAEGARSRRNRWHSWRRRISPLRPQQTCPSIFAGGGSSETGALVMRQMDEGRKIRFLRGKG